MATKFNLEMLKQKTEKQENELEEVLLQSKPIFGQKKVQKYLSLLACHRKMLEAKVILKQREA